MLSCRQSLTQGPKSPRPITVADLLQLERNIESPEGIYEIPTINVYAPLLLPRSEFCSENLSWGSFPSAAQTCRARATQPLLPIQQRKHKSQQKASAEVERATEPPTRPPCTGNGGIRGISPQLGTLSPSIRELTGSTDQPSKETIRMGNSLHTHDSLLSSAYFSEMPPLPLSSPSQHLNSTILCA